MDPINHHGSVLFLGVFVGFMLALSSYPFLSCLIAFFVSGSQTTKFRSDQKKKFEDNFQPGSLLVIFLDFISLILSS